jgi:acyl-CoA synthetase (AMP-forming)/AMP-acid ligase II
MERRDWHLQIVIAGSLPKTSTGKLQRRLLREHYREVFAPSLGKNMGHAAR